MVDLIEKTLREICPGKNWLEICCAHDCGEGSWNPVAGLDKVKESRAKGDLMKPVLVYGFDREERIRQHVSGSILDAAAVFYVRLPALLSDIEAIIEKAAYAEIPTGDAIDKKSFRDYAVKQIRAFKHRCDNLWTSMEMNGNRALRELERSPGVMPKALLEFKAANIQNLLSEYKEQKDLVMKLGITDADKIPGMMNDLFAVTRKIEDKATTPLVALDLAFKSVEVGRAISTILEQVKEL